MRSVIAIVGYILILLMVIQNQLLIAAGAALIFTYYNSAVWLITIGFLVDAYFGAFATTPIFTIISIVWYVIAEFVRPRLLLNQAYE